MKHITQTTLALFLIASVPLWGAAEQPEAEWEFLTFSTMLAAPAIDADGHVYAANFAGELYSLNSDGSLRWLHTGSEDMLEGSPTISPTGDRVYIGSWDNHLYAIDAQTGTLEWRYETGSYIAGSPAVDEQGRIYVGSADGIVYALDPAGSLLWAFVGEGEFEASPALSRDGALFIGDTLGNFYALDSTTGDLTWSVNLETLSPGLDRDYGIYSSAAVSASGHVYVASRNHHLYALGTDGSLLWTFAAAEPIDSSPVIGFANRIHIASYDGNLYALDPEGALVWQQFVGDVLLSSPAIDAQGNVIIVGYAGDGISVMQKLNLDGEVVWEDFWPALNDSSAALSLSGQLVFAFNDGSVHQFDNFSGSAATAWPQFSRSAMRDARLPPDFIQSPQAYFQVTTVHDGDWTHNPAFGWIQTADFPWVYSDLFGWVWFYGSGTPSYWFWSADTSNVYYSHTSILPWLWILETSTPAYLHPSVGLQF